MTGMPDEQGQQQLMSAHRPPRPAAHDEADVADPARAPLAQFAEEWAGRDIGGLRTLATELFGFAAEMSAAAHQDPMTAEALAAVIGQTASIVDGLAVDLAMIQSTLEDEAYVVSRYGVTIGTDGRPPPVSAGPAADAAAASAQHWALAYRQVYEQAMAAAQQARQYAASQLTALFAQLEPSPYALARAVRGAN
jgi:hypothetical protein